MSSEIWKCVKGEREMERRQGDVPHLLEGECLEQHMNALCNSCKKHLTCTANTKEFKRLQLAVLSRNRNCVPGYRNCVMERFRLKALNQAQVTPSEEWLLANVKTRAAWERGWKRCDVYCRWGYRA